MKSQSTYANAMDVAQNLVAWLSPYCERIEVAGSLRRQCPTVGDIEIVAIPFYDIETLDLFGDDTQRISRLDKPMADVKFRVNGPRYKQFLHTPLLPLNSKAWQVDLFLAEPINWGYIQMLRTGSADFTKAMVTPKARGGYKPNHLWLHEGYVYESAIKAPVPLPTETALFDLWDIPYRQPQERN